MKIKLAKSELIHFVGIGGIGMSGLALIMKGKGFKVQGSDISNNKNIERLRKEKIKVFIGHKKQNINFLKDFYFQNNIESRVFSFDHNLSEVLKQGDLCITRAGASSLAELSFLNIPFIAIPLPSSKDNHQYENAKYYEEQDCCWIIDQKNFDDQKFEKFLLELTNKSQDYTTKKNNLQKLNYQNTWNNVNQKILKIINEN